MEIAFSASSVWGAQSVLSVGHVQDMPGEWHRCQDKRTALVFEQCGQCGDCSPREQVDGSSILPRHALPQEAAGGTLSHGQAWRLLGAGPVQRHPDKRGGGQAAVLPLLDARGKGGGSVGVGCARSVASDTLISAVAGAAAVPQQSGRWREKCGSVGMVVGEVLGGVDILTPASVTDCLQGLAAMLDGMRRCVEQCSDVGGIY